MVGLALGADVGGGRLVVQGVLGVRGHVVHANRGHRNHGNTAQRQHLDVLAHVLGLSRERHDNHHIVLGHGVHGALELVASRNNVAEFAAGLHGLGKLLHRVALSVTGAKAVDGARLVDTLE